MGVEIAERLDMARVEADFSCASRKAAAAAFLSCTSILPPGKAIWPECTRKAAVRWVRMILSLVWISGQSDEDQGGAQAGIALRPIASRREREARPHMRKDSGGRETPVSGCLGFHGLPSSSAASIASASSAFAIAKKTPSDDTPKRRVPSCSLISPSSTRSRDRARVTSAHRPPRTWI
jgi:hypothetical protein